MQHALLTVDLGFGDAGKGSMVDFLTRLYGAHTVVRYNGGAQAGHRVVTAGPRPQEHVFAQFGSGTLAGAATHLSRFMLLEPLAMIEEEKHLQMLGVMDAFARTTIDAQALVITPFQRAVNRLRELARGTGRHGSCGMGIGETMSDALVHREQALFAGDLRQPDRLYAKLSFLRQLNLAKIKPLRATLPDTEQVAGELKLLTDPEWAEWLMTAYQEYSGRAQIVTDAYLYNLLQRRGAVIFEGAQGVLLDEWRGFHPYTTWSTTTLANADQLLAKANYSGALTRIGITRAYATRHGAGPFVSEDPTLTAALPDPRNHFGAWQQGFRIGWPDLLLLQYAREVVGPLDALAVTCLDRLAQLPTLSVCHGYQSNDGTLDRIPPSPAAHDLEYQTRLTQMLLHCRPCLEPVADPHALVARLSATLATPVRWLSMGPTAEHKR